MLSCFNLSMDSEKAPQNGRVLRVGIICGGPSAERGISLNSARSVLDHIQGEDLEVRCYYVDCDLNAYAISPAQLYSNTPADFDFKLESLAQGFSSLSSFADHLAEAVDIVFPVIHGRFGEDGGIQKLLENHNIPFVGTGSSECHRAFDKYEASMELRKQGFVTVPSILVQGSTVDESGLFKWFESNQLDPKSGKVVPVKGGSSIGVTVAYGVAGSLERANNIVSEGTDDKVIVEIFLEGGSEFTVTIIDVGYGFDCHPVVLIPSEVELQFQGNVDVKEKDAIFNYRRKYLPTQQVAYYTPSRFPVDVIAKIREGAALLFRRLHLRDFARIGGGFCLLPRAHSHVQKECLRKMSWEQFCLLTLTWLDSPTRTSCAVSFIMLARGSQILRHTMNELVIFNEDRILYRLMKKSVKIKAFKKYLSYLEGTVQSGKYPF